MTNRWFSNIGNGTETGKTGGVHVSVDRAEIVKSAFCPHAPQYIPPISVYKRNTQLFHRRPPFSRGAREKRERGRDEWIRIILIVAGRRGSRPCHFPIFGYVCIHTLDYFVPAVVDFSTGEKIRSILCFQFFEALGRGKSDHKIFRIVLSNREQRVERILGESLVFLFVLLKAATRRDGKERIRISKVEVFFRVEKENESRGTKEREERTNSSQTIKTNDPVAPLVHSFAKINCEMTTDPTK